MYRRILIDILADSYLTILTHNIMTQTKIKIPDSMTQIKTCNNTKQLHNKRIIKTKRRNP